MFRNPSARLLKAAEKGDVPALEKQLAAHADANTVNTWGETPLMLAAKNGHTEAVRLLIEGGARVDLQDHSGNTALIWAARKDHTAAIDLLLEAGANINKGDKYNNTPLIWAVLSRHEKSVSLLIDRGAYIDQRNKWGNTAPDLAAKNQSTDISVLLSKGRSKKKTFDSWLRSEPEKISHIHVDGQSGKRLTEVFNFASRQKTSTSENLRTGTKSTTAPESFDTLDETILRQAFDQFIRHGGKADEAFVFNKKAPPPAP